MRTGNQDIRKSGNKGWSGVLAIITIALVTVGSARAGEDQTREAMKGSIV
jgi:hypothetical protein